MTADHEPVMVAEIVDLFAAVPAGTYVDATLGLAGHAKAILTERDDLDLVGIDRDPAARELALDRLDGFGDRVSVVAGRFRHIIDLVRQRSPEAAVTAVLFDLGVSSLQFDDPERGFSYRYDAPLDMRMNPGDRVSAFDVINKWSHPDLTRLFRDTADERFASRIAARIIDNRPIATTGRLSEVVVSAIPAATRRTGGHPAKRVFQAVRIAVNDELAQIEPALTDAIELLEPRGRGAVLSYHSGEDRLVKRAIAEAVTGGCTCPARLPCACGAIPSVRIVPPRVRRPSDDEQRRNPRSSSALLRCFEKVAQ